MKGIDGSIGATFWIVLVWMVGFATGMMFLGLEQGHFDRQSKPVIQLGCVVMFVILGLIISSVWTRRYRSGLVEKETHG